MSESEVVVFSSLNSAECHLVRSLLLREGISSRLRNHHLAPLAGEVPFDAARVELLVEARQRVAAEAAIAEAGRPQGPDRPCSRCGEPNPPAFETCWSCGDDLPEVPKGPRLLP